MIPLNTPTGLPSRAFWYIALRSFVVALLLLLLGAIFQLFAAAPGASCHGSLCGKFTGGQAAAFVYLFGAFLVVRAVLNFKWFSFTLTDRNIAITSGVLARNTNTIRFDRIQDVNTRRDPLHALLGLKSVAIWTASPDQYAGKAPHPDGLIVLEADDADWLRDYVSDPKNAEGASAASGRAAARLGSGGAVLGFAVALGLVILAVMAWGRKSAPFETTSESGAAPAPAYVTRRGADGRMHPHLVRAVPGQGTQLPAAAQPAASDYGLACAIHPQQATEAVRSCADLALGERCTHEGDFPSRPTAQVAVLTLVNKSNESLKLYWLNPSGARAPYGSVPPGAYLNQQSRTGAHWLVSTTSGQCIGVFDAATTKIGIF